MRAALGWSYDLLGDEEQMMFRPLAVFRSGFILEAAAAVAPGVSDDILSVLGGLVDKSLVTPVDGPGGQRRFRLLEPVRQFAGELLQASGEQDDAAGRHRDHLLSRLATGGHGAPGSATFERLSAEVDNLRAAIDYSLRASQPEAAIRLILAYGAWWEHLGLIDESLDRLEAALRAADAARMPLSLLAAALNQASTWSTYVGRLDDAAASVDRLAQLRDQHPGNLLLRGAWSAPAALPHWFRTGGDRLEGNQLMRQTQDADEAGGQLVGAAYAAVNIVCAYIDWDAADDPDLGRAAGDCTRLAESAGFLNMVVVMRLLDGLIRMMGGSLDAYPSCVDTYAELDALDRGWLAEWGGMYLGVAAELVGDHPVATAQALRFVRFCRRSGVKMRLTFGIRAAARISATAGYPEQALRLWGSAKRIEAVTGLCSLPLMQRLDRPLRQRCTDILGPDATRLLAEAASWSVPQISQAAEEALLTLQEHYGRP